MSTLKWLTSIKRFETSRFCNAYISAQICLPNMWNIIENKIKINLARETSSAECQTMFQMIEITASGLEYYICVFGDWQLFNNSII